MNFQNDDLTKMHLLKNKQGRNEKEEDLNIVSVIIIIIAGKV